jgi:hypothetical protein
MDEFCECECGCMNRLYVDLFEIEDEGTCEQCLAGDHAN